MSDIIDCTSREFPGFFILAAIVDQLGAGMEQFPDKDVTVTLTANGVELPFSATVNDIYRRMGAQRDEEARELAVKMVTAAGLDDLAEALRDVEWRVKEAIANVKV